VKGVKKSLKFSSSKTVGLYYSKNQVAQPENFYMMAVELTSCIRKFFYMQIFGYLHLKISEYLYPL